jgi:phage regulator Rha-like protein
MNIKPSAHPTNPAGIALTVHNSEVKADSRQLAEHLGLEHESIVKLLNVHRAAFEDLGVFRFQIGKLPEGQAGRPPRFALLNEDQAYLLLTMSRNTTRVVSLKVALVKAFSANRMALAAYREGTLPSTKALQDAIQAVSGGPGPWLHSNINKHVNATAGIAARTRVQGAAIAQAMLTLLQSVATQAVQEATDAKDAFRRVKEALRPFSRPVQLLGGT